MKLVWFPIDHSTDDGCPLRWNTIWAVLDVEMAEAEAEPVDVAVAVGVRTLAEYLIKIVVNSR